MHARSSLLCVHVCSGNADISVFRVSLTLSLLWWGIGEHSSHPCMHRPQLVCYVYPSFALGRRCGAPPHDSISSSHCTGLCGLWGFLGFRNACSRAIGDQRSTLCVRTEGTGTPACARPHPKHLVLPRQVSSTLRCFCFVQECPSFRDTLRQRGAVDGAAVWWWVQVSGKSRAQHMGRLMISIGSLVQWMSRSDSYRRLGPQPAWLPRCMPCQPLGPFRHQFAWALPPGMQTYDTGAVCRGQTGAVRMKQQCTLLRMSPVEGEARAGQAPIRGRAVRQYSHQFFLWPFCSSKPSQMQLPRHALRTIHLGCLSLILAPFV